MSPRPFVVVISGGTQVSGWTQGANGIWTAHVDAQDVQQFTVNGEKQTESRYPDVDPSDPVHGGWLWGQDLPAGYDAQKSMAFDPSDYPAGEQPIEGADRDSLVAAIKARGHRHVLPLESSDKLAGMVAELAGPGDYVVCLGAGNITQWAYALPGELAALGAKQ